jgi:hypothetical protein
MGQSWLDALLDTLKMRRRQPGGLPVVPGLAAGDPRGHYVDHRPVEVCLVMGGQALAHNRNHKHKALPGRQLREAFPRIWLVPGPCRHSETT